VDIAPARFHYWRPGRLNEDAVMADTKTPGTPPAGDSAYTQWYEVKSGDTLWKIAKEHYGDGSLYTDIFKANQDILEDPDKIKVGQKLRLP
jgi:nucleoid-associated protein YgaU